MYFSIELIPCFDISGPVLAINTKHAEGYELMLAMLAGSSPCTLPKMDAPALEDSGFIYCTYLSLAGDLSLNSASRAAATWAVHMTGTK